MAKYLNIPAATMIIVDSCAPGNLAHESNAAPETLGASIKRDAWRGYRSNSSEFRTARIADVAGFEKIHGVKLAHGQQPRHIIITDKGTHVVACHA